MQIGEQPWADGAGLLQGDGEDAPEQIPPWNSYLAEAQTHRGDTRLPKVSFVWPLPASLETLASRSAQAGHPACSKAAKPAGPAESAD